MFEILMAINCINNLMTNIDILSKIGTVTIAILNLCFAIKIFYFKDKKDDKEKEKDRKMQLLKTLILDHNLKHYYSIFDDIKRNVEELKTDNLIEEKKQEEDKCLESSFIQFRNNFYDFLLAIDVDLYNGIKNEADILQAHLTNTIFDAGINLSHQSKFDELITQKISESQSKIIEILFKYRGVEILSKV
ncbi:MAG: hypothetical protein QM539_01985 [Alphaproteobacteria bacterium]|nr:hypothetical protein [Alphaproteobacteria bacterium]